MFDILLIMLTAQHVLHPVDNTRIGICLWDQLTAYIALKYFFGLQTISSDVGIPTIGPTLPCSARLYMYSATLITVSRYTFRFRLGTVFLSVHR